MELPSGYSKKGKQHVHLILDSSSEVCVGKREVFLVSPVLCGLSQQKVPFLVTVCTWVR